MNLIEESFREKEEKKKKKTTGIILGAIIFVVIIIIAIVSYLIYIQNTTLKVFLDGKESQKIRQMLVIENDGTIYLPIKEVASYLGYDSYNGEYSDKSESSSKCYVQGKDGNEVANFSLNSNKVYKLDLSSGTENYEYEYFKKPVKAINGVLYASSEAIEKGFNIGFNYDEDKNRIYIYTLPYYVQSYSPKVLDYNYTKLSETFANEKTILQGMLVVEKGEHTDKKVGVIDLNGNAILEPKYDSITYLPDIGDFLVETKEKFGIISKDKRTKVEIIYDSIELMDSDSGLYVAKKGNKYGVIDLNGKIKIFIENDEIGMDISKFEQNNIKNKYILAENVIPARKDKLWGLYDKSGKLIVDFKYDSFGFIDKTNKDALNLLVIPNYNVIVACKDKKYTLLNSIGQELFAAPVADDIYMTISEGQRNYYISVNNGVMNVKDYFDKIGITEKDQTLDNGNSNNEQQDENNQESQENQQVENGENQENQENQGNQENQDNQQTENYQEQENQNNE